jgi:DNA-binding transcriptional regulator GbsR (MarR family)
MSKSGLSAAQRNFIEDVAALFVPWGMRHGLASLYGYLLLKAEPTTLDTIADELGMAKSSVSVAARVLEHYGLARRHGERGSKRVRYGASQSYSGFLRAQALVLGDLSRLIERQAGSVAEDAAVERLRNLGSFYGKMEAAITARIVELTEEALREGLVEQPAA